MKTIVILADGMRPDSLENVPQAQELLKKSSYSLCAETVMPSVTLPCHMSLFHSVTPERHGITTNTFIPQVRPIRGLCEVLNAAGKKCASIYDWEELKDLSRPGNLAFSFFVSGHYDTYEASTERMTETAIRLLGEDRTDFLFLYYGIPDMIGHGKGWMTDEYLASVRLTWECIDRVIKTLSDDYAVIITADHGGHDRTHGYDIPEDMTIPVIAYGKPFEAGKQLENVSIIDIAPTVTKILEVAPDAEWEGKSFI